LNVKPALKFVKRLEENTVGIEEESIDLVVEVTKPNQRCKWLRNGRVINPSEDKFAGR
jgi:hypothetical protein